MFTTFSPEGYAQIFPGIHLKTVVVGDKTHLTHVRLEQGVQLPLHSHPHEQTGYLISGRMRFVIGGEAFEAGPGDGWCIPGGVPHSAEVYEETFVIEVFSPAREDYLALRA
jgi:quercetin dioxygenase-like cupin family protein